MKIYNKIVVSLILTTFIMHIQLNAEETKISPEKCSMIKAKIKINQVYQAEGNDEFIKEILTDSEFCGGLYSCFVFKKDHTFILKFDDYQEEVKFTEKGIWEIKDGNLIVKFQGNHKSWSGSYKLLEYILAFDDKMKYHYTITIYIKDKTPWHDQGLAYDFN